MADANYNGLDQTPADYAVERGALWADKSNRRSRFGPTDTGARCVAEWGDDLDNAHRAMQARLAFGVVNVLEFGAVGDGVTDDTDAIAAAVEAAGDRAVYLPPGTYVRDGGNIDASGFTLLGEVRIEGIRILVGDGTPEGNVSAPRGSTYHRRDGGAGSSFYVKESGTGSTGWAAK